MLDINIKFRDCNKHSGIDCQGCPVNRNYNFDWVRVIAMIGVMTDHYICCVGDKALELIGLQMGGGQRNTLHFAFGTFVRK